MEWMVTSTAKCWGESLVSLAVKISNCLTAAAAVTTSRFCCQAWYTARLGDSFSFLSSVGVRISSRRSPRLAGGVKFSVRGSHQTTECVPCCGECKPGLTEGSSLKKNGRSITDALPNLGQPGAGVELRYRSGGG